MSGYRPKLLEHEKVITPEEKEVLLSYLTTPEREWTRSSVIMRLVLKTGLRASEVTNLKVKHCVLEGKRPMIYVKGGKKRDRDHIDVVKINDETAALLTGWLQRTTPKEYVFEVVGHKICRNTVWNDCKRAYSALDFSVKYGVHALRHRFITDTYKAFRDPVVTMNQARHKSLAMTTRYIHLATEESEEFREKLSLV